MAWKLSHPPCDKTIAGGCAAKRKIKEKVALCKITNQTHSIAPCFQAHSNSLPFPCHPIPSHNASLSAYPPRHPTQLTALVAPNFEYIAILLSLEFHVLAWSIHPIFPIMAALSAITSDEPARPWHAAYPTPLSQAAALPRQELLQWLEGAKVNGKDFVLVDLRRDDYKVC